MSISVSVIIPTYNTALLIERTLGSVLSQNGTFELEVIVVDDCSGDDTLAKVEAIADRRIKILQQADNRGPAAARNRGLLEATGKYTAFLDGDDYWLPGFLEKTTNFLEAHPDAVAVSVGQCHKIIGKKDSIAPAFLKDANDPRNKTSFFNEDFYAFWAENFHICTGSALFSTEIARTLGGQREDLRICEDLEFWAMLATAGAWGFIPEVLFVSDGGEVTKAQGWQEKNQRRWNSAVPVKEWARRISPRLTPEQKAGFSVVLGRMARNTAYFLVMSKRSTLARQSIKDFPAGFKQDKLGKIMLLAAKNILTWKLLCQTLIWREQKRKV
jgi:glycosyltransferase involved in cell wall biosynthesis